MKSSIKMSRYKSLPDSLYQEWETLWRSSTSANIFNSVGWFKAACKAFDYDEKIIMVARGANSGKLVAVLPLIKTKRYGFSVFVLPAEEFIDHFKILADLNNKAVVLGLFNELAMLGTICITGLDEGDINLFSNKSKYINIFPTDENPYINCEQKTLVESAILRKSKSTSRAERLLGNLKFFHIISNYKSALKTAFEIDQLSARHKKGKGTFWRRDTRLFFTLLSEEIPSCFFVNLLFFGENPAAYSIGFMHNGIYACSQKAYLSTYKKYRPGHLCFRKFLEMIIEKDSKEIDIGRGYDQFKKEFTKTVRVLHSAIISKNRAIPFLIKLSHRMEKVLYSFLERHWKLYVLLKRLRDGMPKVSDQYEAE